MKPYILSHEQLRQDLDKAYLCARKNKRKKPYQMRFEANAEANLASLCDELWNKTYKPLPSTCFIITDPKKREVFAADFRDRIVHHLYYNYVHEIFERTFIQDSYSCIKNRGTHYGIHRLEHHIRRESQNYTEPCHVLKMDIRGYFMSIDRNRLFSIAINSLTDMGGHRISKHGNIRWCEVVDMEFVKYLTKELVYVNPVNGCHVVGSVDDWIGLPDDKSLFHAGKDRGLPIGNLTSQLFSNVYLNVFDQFMKRTLGCHGYGRYVDDSYVVSADKDFLLSVLSEARSFLRQELGLRLHEGKTFVRDIRLGVEFLGAFLKPGRSYISNQSLRRMKNHVSKLEHEDNPFRIMSSVNSFLGVLGHYKSAHIQKSLFFGIDNVWRYGLFRINKKGFRYQLSKVNGDGSPFPHLH